MNLPKLNGLTAAARILKASSATKIVFLSQVNDQDIVHAAHSVGGSAFVQKRKAATDLLSAIAARVRRQWHEKGTNLGPYSVRLIIIHAKTAPNAKRVALIVMSKKCSNLICRHSAHRRLLNRSSVHICARHSSQVTPTT